MTPCRIITAILCFFLYAFAQGCHAPGPGLPVVGIVELTDSAGSKIMWMHTDGDTMIAKSAQAGRVYLRDKLSGLTILGPVDFTTAGEVLVTSRSREYKAQFAAGAKLPLWIQSTGVFLPGEAQALGLTFEDAPPVEPPKPTPSMATLD